ncbi:MAG: phosphoglycerate kinase [Flavobacteriales bacterium]|nr:phosphoglycerate kinase [Flavobacteriales bacterium]|tara:strand:- start:10819 stop:12009 length:1191 start_codon:yes stop_codon:yes gene_type:complete
MNTVRDYDFSGKKAIVRVDFNVPLDDHFNVTDDTRIRAAAPTIKTILEKGGSAILMSHLGRPKNGPEDKFSLKHIVTKVSEHLGVNVKFVSDCIGEDVEAEANNLKAGEVLLLDNLRFYKEETNGDNAFAEKLAKLADCYVNDAFGTAHRAHASTTIIAKFFPKDKMFGLLLAGELESIEKAIKTGKAPLTAIMGGSKVSSKIQIITQLLDKVDNLIIGGGMGYTFSKAKGGKIGNSIVEDDFLETALNVLKEAEEKGVNIYLPVDSLIADDFSNDANTKVASAGEIPDGWEGLDCGPESRKVFGSVIEQSGTVLWNGPVGVFEMETFGAGTKAIAESVVRATENGAFTLIGGGDSVAAINKYGLADQVSYISTGGGALLELLEGKVLPGVDAVLN